MLKAALVSIVAVDGHDEAALLALAARAAHALEPQFGGAILESARERGVETPIVDDIQEVTETGVVASIEGRTVVVGTAALFSDLGVSTASLGEWPERLRQRGQQVLLVSVDGRIAGFLGVINDRNE